MDRLFFLLNVPAHLTRDNRPDLAVMVKTVLLDDGDMYVSFPHLFEAPDKDIVSRWDVVYCIAEARSKAIWDRKKNATIKSQSMFISHNGQLIINQNYK